MNSIVATSFLSVNTSQMVQDILPEFDPPSIDIMCEKICDSIFFHIFKEGRSDSNRSGDTDENMLRLWAKQFPKRTGAHKSFWRRLPQDGLVPVDGARIDHAYDIR